MKKITLILILAVCLCSCASRSKYNDLEKDLTSFVDGKNAEIGVAVIIGGKDTISVNGDKSFPMLSVYKFPIALALADYGLTGAEMIADSLTITRNDLKPDTYSPMRNKYGDVDSVRVSMDDLLAYSLQQSDNNASDILLSLLPEVGYVNHFLQRDGFNGISIVNTEDEMHADPALCYQNSSTPLAMARLIDRFDTGRNDYFAKKIKRLMETCETGTSRLPKPLMSTNAVIGHKTGTGFPLPDGGLQAVNDVGYVHLPDGRRYSIAVFIADSHYNIEETEAFIARVSEMVFNVVK